MASTLSIHRQSKESHGAKGFEKVDYHFALIMDEMKTNSSLVYRKHTGEISRILRPWHSESGNEELEAAVECNQNPRLKLAEQILSFMIRPSLDHLYPSWLQHTHN